MKRIVVIVVIVFVVIFFFLALRPVRVSEENSAHIVGRVCSVYADSIRTMDMVINICDDEHIYFINRGLEYGPSLTTLEALVGDEIRISYAKHWSPLNPGGVLKHVVEIVVRDSVIYSEL